MAVFAMSDLHGCGWAWKKIKEYLNPEDEIICLGDIIDRGPDSWELFKTIYNDPQVKVILRGNHEDMMVNAIRDYLIDGYMWDYQSYSLCIHNGGRQTLADWEIDPDRIDWFKRLRDLPTWDTYYVNDREIILCHAGFTPWMEESGTSYELPCDEDLIWDRDHLFESYDENKMEDIIIVHGHTTIIHLIDYVNDIEESVDNIEIATYCDGHKIDIDLCTVYTDKIALLNLDTLIPIYFEKV
jgi:serine/threonine protein phosphatase 1